MRRREFISLLGGAVAAWPLAARAQQSTTPVVGILSPLAPGSGEYLLDAFRRGLGESSYVEGQNVTIDYRFAAGRFDRLREMAADLVQRRVSVIAAFGNVAAVATKAATALWQAERTAGLSAEGKPVSGMRRREFINR
jgi:putative ABC transport system substrate-binding protein